MISRGQLIETMADRAYRCGMEPLDFATWFAAFLIEEAFDLADSDPVAAQLARQVLDADWVMPAGTAAP